MTSPTRPLQSSLTPEEINELRLICEDSGLSRRWFTLCDLAIEAVTAREGPCSLEARLDVDGEPHGCVSTLTRGARAWCKTHKRWANKCGVPDPALSAPVWPDRHKHPIESGELVKDCIARANDADNWADSYTPAEEYRQHGWFTSFASTFRRAASGLKELEKKLEEAREALQFVAKHGIGRSADVAAAALARMSGEKET